MHNVLLDGGSDLLTDFESVQVGSESSVVICLNQKVEVVVGITAATADVGDDWSVLTIQDHTLHHFGLK